VLRSGAAAVETAWCFLEDGAVVGAGMGAADVPALEAEVRDALRRVRETTPEPVTTKPEPVCMGCPGLRVACPVAAAASSQPCAGTAVSP
jgi:hypothetical protein